MSITEKTKSEESTKHRAAFWIDRDLHRKAVTRAEKVYATDFTGLVIKLLVDDLTNGPRLDPDDDGVYLRPKSLPQTPETLKKANQEAAENNRRAKAPHRRDRVR
jgi:hypothetical protein